MMWGKFGKWMIGLSVVTDCGPLTIGLRHLTFSAFLINLTIFRFEQRTNWAAPTFRTCSIFIAFHRNMQYFPFKTMWHHERSSSPAFNHLNKVGHSLFDIYNGFGLKHEWYFSRNIAMRVNWSKHSLVVSLNRSERNHKKSKLFIFSCIDSIFHLFTE